MIDPELQEVVRATFAEQRAQMLEQAQAKHQESEAPEVHCNFLAGAGVVCKAIWMAAVQDFIELRVCSGSTEVVLKL